MLGWVGGATLWLAAVTANVADHAELARRLEGIDDPAQRLALIEDSADASRQWTRVDQGERLIALGLALEANHRIDDAYAAYDQAVTLLRAEPKPVPALVAALLERSYVSYVRTNDARVYCPDREEAVRIAREIGDAEALANALVKHAFCFQNQPERFAEGVAMLDEAVAVAGGDAGTGDLRAMVFNATANLYRSVQLHHRSYEYLGKALALWTELDHRQDMFNMNHTMVAEAMRLGREDDARRHVQALFELERTSPGFPDFAFFAHYNDGLVHHLGRRDAEAVAALDRAVALEATTQERYFVDMAYGMRAVSAYRAGRGDRGLADAQRFLASGTAEISPALAVMNEAIAAEVAGDAPAAIARLWQLSADEERARRQSMLAIYDAQARLLDDRIAVYDNRFLQQQLALERSERERAEDQRRAARLQLILVSVVGAGLLLGAVLLWRSRRELRVLAETDALTALSNRRRLFTAIDAAIASAGSVAGALLLVDVDHFKRFNDRHGHQVGDAVLVAVAAALRAACPPDAVVARVGGEEFAVLLPAGVDAAGVAQALRSRLPELELPRVAADDRVTVSIGIAALGPDAADTYRRADAALYAAKHGGRDRVATWAP
jgi:diguanylate cyclase (GGDEF)-like protein